MSKWKYIVCILVPFFLVTCRHDNVTMNWKKYQTKNVVIIVIDGPRYSETWGDSTHQNIPERFALLPEGVLVDQFYNNGMTLTNPGHCAISTGNYEPLANNGSELPHYPTIFQAWLRFTHESSMKAAVIASKDKLHVLSNSLASGYYNTNRPYFDCGVNGDGTGGYRSDSITQLHILQVLQFNRPRLLLINFKDPDVYAHMANYNGYIAAIRKTDEYVAEIWNYLQSDPLYKDKTTLIVTNDHGRHLDGISNGYVSHGDNCAGCRRIEFFALSPDFKKNAVITSTSYEQIDIPATVAELMHFALPHGKGRVMKEVFQ